MSTEAGARGRWLGSALLVGLIASFSVGASECSDQQFDTVHESTQSAITELKQSGKQFTALVNRSRNAGLYHREADSAALARRLCGEDLASDRALERAIEENQNLLAQFAPLLDQVKSSEQLFGQSAQGWAELATVCRAQMNEPLTYAADNNLAVSEGYLADKARPLAQKSEEVMALLQREQQFLTEASRQAMVQCRVASL